MLSMHILLLSVLLIANIDKVQNSRILGLFPHPGLSHFKFFQPILKGLADAGHQVVVVSYFPVNNGSQKNYVDLVLPQSEEILTNKIDLEHFADSSIFDYYISFFELRQWGVDFCNSTLHSKAIDDVLQTHKDHPFDLVIAEAFNSDCMLGVAHLLQVPVVALSSCSLMPWHYDRFALPDTPSFIPSQFVGFSENMSFYERAVNFWITKTIKLLYRVYNEDNKILEQRFGKGIPDVAELASQTSLMLVNQHFSLSGPRPLSPQVIEVGGLHIKETKPLPEDIQNILDNAKEGVVYVSWGSMIRANSLPEVKRNAIVEAVRQLKQTVLWKWETDSLPNKPDNLHIRKWLPQQEILCHPNVKVFLAHGGLMGLSESAYCGVPAVITPIYGDQFLNAAAYVHRGAGIILDYKSINSTEAVLQAIQVALTPSFYENAKVLSTAYKNRPVDPLDLAIRWVEYVLETKGAKLMQSHSVHMNFITYYSLDIIGVLLAICYFLFKQAFGLLSNNKQTETFKTHSKSGKAKIKKN